MKGDRDLDESLEKSSIRFRRNPPDLFENLVSLEELGRIEQADAFCDLKRE